MLIFQDEDPIKCIDEMIRYVKQNGFTVHDFDGRFTIADVVLIAREPTSTDALCKWSFIELVDPVTQKRRKGVCERLTTKSL